MTLQVLVQANVHFTPLEPVDDDLIFRLTAGKIDDPYAIPNSPEWYKHYAEFFAWWSVIISAPSKSLCQSLSSH